MKGLRLRVRPLQLQISLSSEEKKMGNIRARTRECGSRRKVRASHRAAAAAAVPEGGEDRILQMLERLMNSVDQLREEIAMGFERMDNRFDDIHALVQRMGQRSAAGESWVSALPGPSFRPFPPADRSS
ncbi:uncharacterized protein LOC117923281 isoform X2 [Vitis riparia]|nr:uncharacterized protein LOC117923281 isoform X2 [Vitis riparia]